MTKNAAAKIAKKRRSTSNEGRGPFILIIFGCARLDLYLQVVFRGCASVVPRSSICRSRWRLLHAHLRCADNSSYSLTGRVRRQSTCLFRRGDDSDEGQRILRTRPLTQWHWQPASTILPRENHVAMTVDFGNIWWTARLAVHPIFIIQLV